MLYSRTINSQIVRGRNSRHAVPLKITTSSGCLIDEPVVSAKISFEWSLVFFCSRYA